MFDKEIKKFDTVIRACKYRDKHLLLGNGFSCAYSKKFSYDYISNDENIEEIIENLNVEKERNNSIRDFYLGLGDIILAYQYEDNNSDNEIANIRLNFLLELAKIHDSGIYPNDMKFCTTINLFLFWFKNIFTLNFDLLLYWAIIFSQREGKNISSSIFIPDDGFRKRNGKLIWTNDENNAQNIFYLHGGLHLFIDDEYECYYKRLYDSKIYSTIIKQFKKSLDIGNPPFVVIGGNSDDKLKQISEDRYLRFCYSKLRDIKGDLFIHGHSLNKVDEHIFDIIFTISKKGEIKLFM